MTLDCLADIQGILTGLYEQLKCRNVPEREAETVVADLVEELEIFQPRVEPEEEKALLDLPPK